MHRHRHGTESGADYKRTIKSLTVGAELLILLSSLLVLSTPSNAQSSHHPPSDQLQRSKVRQDSGILVALSPEGEHVGKFPLRHTTVDTKISGYVASVTVTQEFQNIHSKKIDAVYSFPLSDSGAVDKMTMKINGRVIEGKIKTKEAAREIYEKAKAEGHAGSLLDQTSANRFTQSIANIKPGDNITITLHYEELLSFESGQFKFTFPLGMSVPADKASQRQARELTLNADIDAGVPIAAIHSNLDGMNTKKRSDNRSVVSLHKKDIPAENFVLTWDVSGDQIKSGYLTHTDAQPNNGNLTQNASQPANGNLAHSASQPISGNLTRNASQPTSGYFTLMVMPPKKPSPQQTSSKELIFLVDCSGSQEGGPLEKAKTTVKYIIDHMNPDDTFQIIAFNEKTQTLFDKPEHVNLVSKLQSKNFIDSLIGRTNSGSWKTAAVEKMLSMPNDSHRLRIVSFMTDGYMGYNQEVIGLIHKYRSDSRWFPFGVDYWVNRPFIRDIASEGGGEPEFVPLSSLAEDVGKKFYDRFSAPVLTQVKVDFGDLKVNDIFPREVGDVWAQRPLFFQGRYTQPGSSKVTISGYAAGKPYKETLDVVLPANQPEHAVLAPLWAKTKVDALMSENFSASLNNAPGYEGGGGGSAPPTDFQAESLHGFAAVTPDGYMNENLKNEVTNLGLQHHIMTNYTSYVAVDENRATNGGDKSSVNVRTADPDYAAGSSGNAPSLQGATKWGQSDRKAMMQRSSLGSILRARSEPITWLISTRC